jgi:hypothetical protein
MPSPGRSRGQHPCDQTKEVIDVNGLLEKGAAVSRRFRLQYRICVVAHDDQWPVEVIEMLDDSESPRCDPLWHLHFPAARVTTARTPPAAQNRLTTVRAVGAHPLAYNQLKYS